MRVAYVLCCSVAMLGMIGTASAQDWTKSKWGPNDEIGAANYMTPELVLKAAGLIKTGKTYALGIPRRFQDAGLSAARLQDHRRPARPGRQPGPRAEQDDL